MTLNLTIISTPEIEILGEGSLRKFVKKGDVFSEWEIRHIRKYIERNSEEQVRWLRNIQRQLRLFEFLSESADLTGKETPEGLLVVEKINCLYRGASAPGIFYGFYFTNPCEVYLREQLIKQLPFDY